MADRLEALLAHFSVRAHMFHSGALCGINDVPSEGELGQLHLIQSGPVEVRHQGAASLNITEPSLLLYPRPMAHRFVTDAKRGADMACANLQFDGGSASPIAAALPPVLCLPLERAQRRGEHTRPALRRSLQPALWPAGTRRQAVRSRADSGAAISDGDGRGAQWNARGTCACEAAARVDRHPPATCRGMALETLADVAGMSRTVFADSFQDTIGCTPGAYLQELASEPDAAGVARGALAQDDRG